MQNIKQIQQIHNMLTFFHKQMRMHKRTWAETHIQAGGVRTGWGAHGASERVEILT